MSHLFKCMMPASSIWSVLHSSSSAGPTLPCMSSTQDFRWPKIYATLVVIVRVACSIKLCTVVGSYILALTHLTHSTGDPWPCLQSHQMQTCLAIMSTTILAQMNFIGGIIAIEQQNHTAPHRSMLQARKTGRSAKDVLILQTLSPSHIPMIHRRA